MKAPKVLLIYPPNQLMAMETARPNGSLGPLYLAGELERMGIEVDVLDANIGSSEDNLQDTFYNPVEQENGLLKIGMSWERIEEFISKGNYDIVGITADFTPQTRMAFKIAAIVKKVNPRILVITGGINARSMFKRFIREGTFDLICMTEGEKAIREIVQRDDYDGIKGLLGNPPDFYDNLDDLPLPAWHKLPLDRYEQIAAPHGADLTGQTHRYAPLMTSRGCPFQCAYCHISTERFNRNLAVGNLGNLRVKSIQRVIQEIDVLQSLGVKKIFIEDDSLLAKKDRIIKIFTAIKDRNLVIADVNGVNLVHLLKKVGQKLEPDEEYLELLFNGGLKQIVFPVESGSQRILDKYATGKLVLETMNVVNLTKIAKKLGIICPVNMMIGFPDETEAEIMQSIELSKKLIDAGADYIAFFLPIPFPGSQLFEMATREGYLNPDFDPDIMNIHSGIMENTTVSRERMVELRDWAWRTVNRSEYVYQRLQKSLGERWQPK